MLPTDDNAVGLRSGDGAVLSGAEEALPHNHGSLVARMTCLIARNNDPTSWYPLSTNKKRHRHPLSIAIRDDGDD